MAKIEKFECIENNGNIEKTIMTIVNENERQEAEVYLAFADNTTGKRYLMYTTDVKTNENDKITFSLSTLSLQEQNYILEGTDNVDYSNVQLPVINIVGLNNQKDDNEIMNLIDEKFGKGNITIIDLRVLEKNVSSIVISDTKPAKKANVPVIIANGIKKFYLARLNKLLTEVYSTTVMTEEQASVVNEKLDKIDNKLDDLTSTYEGYKQTKSVEKSLEEIRDAKLDIEQAKNRINNLVADENEELEEEISESFTNEEDVQPEVEENIETSSEKEEQPIEESKSETQVNEELKEQQPEEPVQEQYAELEVPTESKNIDLKENMEKQINSSVNTLVKIIITEELSVCFNNAINKIADNISSIYKEEMENAILKHNKELENVNLQHNEELKTLMTQQNDEKQLLTETLNKSTDKLKEEKTKNENLTQENTTLNADNENLKKQNSELEETIVSKDEQLSQQNSMIESFREEIKNTKESSSAREQELLSQIEQLKSENVALAAYKQRFEQVASMFGGQTVSQPTVEQTSEKEAFTQTEINEAVDYATAPYVQEEQSTKTL